MSHEIIYDRRFIRLPNNKIIPMTLCGSSNCTMFVNGREILERRWSPYMYQFDQEIIVDANEYTEKVNNIFNNDNPNIEEFVYRSKWICSNDVLTFIKNGIKNAFTIEEYVLNGYPLYCSLSFYNPENGWEKSNSETIRTTDEFMNWYETAKNTEKNGFSKFYNIDFLTIKPLSVHINKSTNSSVIVKMGRSYISKITKYSVSCSVRPEDAMVFSSEDDFMNVLRENGHDSFTRFNKCNVCSVDCLKSATIEKPYRVQIVGGYNSGNYVKRVSSAHLFSTPYSDSAMRFPTEHKARIYADRLKNEHHYDGIRDFVVVRP